MTDSCYVFAYVNPDTDGVCSSLGYSYLKRVTVGKEFIPVVFGSMNRETYFVLDYFNVNIPIINPEIPINSKLAIVDTHHINQLPTNITFTNVVEVIDHHPAGDPTAFPNAIIQNENVGAVATLLTERIKSNNIEPDRKIAGVLIAAIISNTLNFFAPSTSTRDKEALEWLNTFVNIEPKFVDELFESRIETSPQSSREILLSDYKEFNMGNFRFGISQIESIRIQDVIIRSDLLISLLQIKNERKIDHVFLNLIDIKNKVSIIVCPEPATQELLKRVLGAEFHGGFAQFTRILLRKTDLIPQLQNAVYI